MSRRRARHVPCREKKANQQVNPFAELKDARFQVAVPSLGVPGAEFLPRRAFTGLRATKGGRYLISETKEKFSARYYGERARAVVYSERRSTATWRFI